MIQFTYPTEDKCAALALYATRKLLGDEALLVYQENREHSLSLKKFNPELTDFRNWKVSYSVPKGNDYNLQNELDKIKNPIERILVKDYIPVWFKVNGSSKEAKYIIDNYFNNGIVPDQENFGSPGFCMPMKVDDLKNAKHLDYDTVENLLSFYSRWYTSWVPKKGVNYWVAKEGKSYAVYNSEIKLTKEQRDQQAKLLINMIK